MAHTLCKQLFIHNVLICHQKVSILHETPESLRSLGLYKVYTVFNYQHVLVLLH